MILGIERFREWFRGYEDHYVIIGGTACDLLMAEEGLEFRGTKDIDLVLIVEAVTAEFGLRFWEFVREAGYVRRCKSNGEQQFYRFTNPVTEEYPKEIELFSRRVGAIVLPEDAVLTPLPLAEDISSLSAILLDDDYYQLLRNGTVVIDGVTILDAAYLIPFKAKAWLDLSARKADGESVDSSDIRKHKNDIFRLSALLIPGTQIEVNQNVWNDLQAFFAAMQTEHVDTKQLKLRRKKEDILVALREQYITR
jgi:hypothetical protein